MPVVVRRGKRYFEFEGKRYDLQGKPFIKFINKTRKVGIKVADKISIGTTDYIINPFVSGKGSRTSLVALEYTARGQLTKRSEKLIEKFNEEWDKRKPKAGDLILRIVASGAKQEIALYDIYNAIKDHAPFGEVRCIVEGEDFDGEIVKRLDIQFVIPNKYKPFRHRFVDSDDWKFSMGDTFSFYSPTPVVGRRLRQRFRDGIQHCVFTPILNKLNRLRETCLSTATKKRHSQRIQLLEKLVVDYEAGVPEDDMEDIAKKSGFKITMINVFDHNLHVYNENGKVGNLTLCNTRENHVEEGSIVWTNECKEVSVEEIKRLYLQCRKNNEFFHVEGNFINNAPSRLFTLEGAFKVANPEKDVFRDFNKRIGLQNYGLNATKYPDVNEFIKEARIINSVPVMINEGVPTGHRDMPNAYSQFKRCSYYMGFLGKIHQWRNGVFDREFITKHIGLYRATIQRCDDKMFQLLGLQTNMSILLTTPEILYFMDNGVEMTMDMGVWGARFDFEFDDEMLKDKRYQRWSGILGCENHHRTYTFPASREFASHLESYNQYSVYYWNQLKLASVKVPKDNVMTHHHILAFITSYMRIQMLQAMKAFEPSQIIKVVMDGIYYRGDLPVAVEWFKVKPIEVEHSYFESWYMPSECQAVFPPIHYNNNTCILGQGGSGKTHGILTNTGYNNILYVSPSHVLGKRCRDKYGVVYTTINKLIGAEVEYNDKLVKCVPFKDDRFYPNVICIDESTQIPKAWIDKVFTMYDKSLIFICGDLDLNGMPYQTRNGDGNTYTELWKPENIDVVMIEGDRRSQCDILKQEKINIRDYMRQIYTKTDDDCELSLLMRQYALKRYETISFDKAVSMFQSGDTWIAGTHKTNKTLLQSGVVSGWYKKGGYVSWTEEAGYEKRGSFTIHSYQGSTIETGKVFISIDDMFDFAMLYTAVSRAIHFNQLIFVA